MPTRGFAPAGDMLIPSSRTALLSGLIGRGLSVTGTCRPSTELGCCLSGLPSREFFGETRGEWRGLAVPLDAGLDSFERGGLSS